jgi:hypothetical protein
MRSLENGLPTFEMGLSIADLDAYGKSSSTRLFSTTCPGSLFIGWSALWAAPDPSDWARRFTQKIEITKVIETRALPYRDQIDGIDI